MFHTDIYVSRNHGKERKIHAHYNYTGETILAVREAVTKIGREEKCRGPYDVKVYLSDDHGAYKSAVELKMELSDDLKSAYLLNKSEINT